MQLKKTFFHAAFFVVSILAARAASYEPATIISPAPAREFRGAWIATVKNLDWPSKAGISTAAQKEELISILNRAAQLKLNAVILQVRPACDALYASPFEPWSEYLTGTMGKGPDPFYDPLAFAIEEAHKRGLELHAWFNPYRALDSSHLGNISPNHVARAHPELVRKITSGGKTLLWLDPGERDVRDHTLKVMMDVVRRYDVDGVQIDDYFYPDQDPGRSLDLFDEASWKKFGGDGKLNRDDWRRENINGFIERIYQSIKSVKPWVKFGISPRGIWRPGHPQQIRGADNFLEHYADSRKWLMNGWVDYLSPQLYWPIEPLDQSFPTLLQWWTQQNPRHRHVWPGIAAYNAGRWKPDEIANQIQLARKQSGVTGYVLYRTSSLLQNPALADTLAQTLNRESALVPASPWLGTAPGRPLLTATNVAAPAAVKITWRNSSGETIRRWVLQTKSHEAWQTEIVPSNKTSASFTDRVPDAIVVSAMDRAGNLSLPAVLVLRPEPQSPKEAPSTARHRKSKIFKKYSSPKHLTDP